MATTQEILDLAQALGKQIGTHEASIKFEKSLKLLQGDVEAQRLLNDYQRHMAKIAEKETKGDPIEVDDKRRLEDLQGQVISHPTLRDLQVSQMDYLDLMRQVDEVISGRTMAGGAPEGMDQDHLGGPEAGSPLIAPES